MKGRRTACIRGMLILASVFTAWLFPSRTLSTVTAETRADLPYVVAIHGAPAEPSDVGRLLGEVSQTIQKKYEAPPYMALLKRRAEGDLQEMQKVLRSFGSFRGNVITEVMPAAWNVNRRGRASTGFQLPSHGPLPSNPGPVLCAGPRIGC